MKGVDAPISAMLLFPNDDDVQRAGVRCLSALLTDREVVRAVRELAALNEMDLALLNNIDHLEKLANVQGKLAIFARVERFAKVRPHSFLFLCLPLPCNVVRDCLHHLSFEESQLYRAHSLRALTRCSAHHRHYSCEQVIAKHDGGKIRCLLPVTF